MGPGMPDELPLMPTATYGRVGLVRFRGEVCFRTHRPGRHTKR
jgi:hypothetical protein